ncbi:iron transporter [Halosimplex halophilum]|uniref:iron transporter n=1 Tax=Halosimplex halophilum TaxID=2559572 RepID=UPI00107FB3B4|nr:iron transporter [Halosimplex halophilum]
MSQHGKQPSEEVDDRQLRLAREAGDAYRAAVDYMIEEVAHTGDTREAGDYVVGFAQEEAEGLYELVGEGEFEWREPDDENAHIEVAVADADDGRMVPGAEVSLRISDRDGEQVEAATLPLLWHPGLYHYGANVRLPGDGTYTLEIRVEPPTMHRHDEENGDRYGEPVEVTFEGVDVKTGQG